MCSFEDINITDICYSFLQYLDVISLQRSSAVSKHWRNLVMSTDADKRIWKFRCEERGFKNTGMTKTRGKRLWRDIYLSNMCINCYDTRYIEDRESNVGVVVVDIDGGFLLKSSYQQHIPIGAFGSRIALCSLCVQSVTDVSNFSDRKKLCLQRLKHRRQGAFDIVWNKLLDKIPLRLTTARAKDMFEGDGHPSGAYANDFLLRHVVSASHPKKRGRKDSS